MKTRERVYVFVDDGVVTNRVVINDESQVEQFLPLHDLVVEVTDAIPSPSLHWTYDEHFGFRPKEPFLSWVWETDPPSWTAPVPVPEPTDKENPEPYEWDEETLSWVVPQWWLDSQEKQDKTEEVG